MGRKKKGLTLYEHRVLGAKLIEFSNFLSELAGRLNQHYPLPIPNKCVKVDSELAKLRSMLDSQISKDMGTNSSDFNTAYFGPKPYGICKECGDVLEVDDQSRGTCKYCDSVGPMEEFLNPTGPHGLPKAKLNSGKTYYIDLLLIQLRNVDNPHDWLSFKSHVEIAEYLAKNAVSDFDAEITKIGCEGFASYACNNCGAFNEKPENIIHHQTCVSGSLLRK